MPPRTIMPGPERRCVFEPQCTHMTMTRIYDPSLLCLNCRCPGPSGWLYHCTQDREDLIEHAFSRGEVASFDVLGERMLEQLKIRKGSPAAREDKLSLLDEMTPNQMAAYRPDQIAIMLRQRENVQTACQFQRLRTDNSAEITSHRNYSTAFEGAPGPFEYKKPWVATFPEECRYRVCPRCRPALADRAFLSLNAVANGDIPPTAAVGYGFHTMGERPVFDAEMVQTLGIGVFLKAGEPGPQRRPKTPQSERQLPPMPKVCGSRNYFRSSESIRQLFGKPFAVPQPAEERSGAAGRPQDQGSTPGFIKHSPRCENLGKLAEQDKGIDLPTRSRPLRPPPGLPIPSGAEWNNGWGHRESTSDHDTESTIENTEIYPLPETVPLSSKSTGHGEADPRVHHADSHSPSPRDDSPDTSAKFASSPLKVKNGVAVLEESVELGVPDVVRHT
ncbi:hypothetical protein L249_1646 [Ophiocordyceps polyrhachis-furcata BCC 54312]|uniref:Uncharacterized protein n=1 Tax=Ophiocordyceps polyrhachis-furcata BCC 54312 TaxID=1330021 RepID=A0A367KZK3_9HYPO|nr:hypothetical protein L249_1646 [Ophiocordyceps polyrhachis-furcata BCC 54312]